MAQYDGSQPHTDRERDVRACVVHGAQSGTRAHGGCAALLENLDDRRRTELRSPYTAVHGAPCTTRSYTGPYTKIDQLRRGALASGTTNLRAPRRLWSILNLRVHTGSRSTNSDGEVCSSGTMIDQLSPGGFVQADAVLHAVCPLCARIAVSRGEVCSSDCSFVHDRPTLAGSLEIGTTTRRCSPSTLVDLDETGAQGCARFKIDQLSRGAVPSGTTNPSVPRRSWSILNGTARGFKIDQNPQGAGRLVQPLVGAPCESWSILMAPATQVRRLQHPYGDSRRLEEAIELRTLHDLPPVG